MFVIKALKSINNNAYKEIKHFLKEVEGMFEDNKY